MFLFPELFASYTHPHTFNKVVQAAGRKGTGQRGPCTESARIESFVWFDSTRCAELVMTQTRELSSPPEELVEVGSAGVFSVLIPWRCNEPTHHARSNPVRNFACIRPNPTVRLAVFLETSPDDHQEIMRDSATNMEMQLREAGGGTREPHRDRDRDRRVARWETWPRFREDGTISAHGSTINVSSTAMTPKSRHSKDNSNICNIYIYIYRHHFVFKSV